MSKIALDTNVLIYLLDANEQSEKRRIANELVAAGPYISSQVISEYLNVCHNRFKMSKQNSVDSLMTWLSYCELSSFEIPVYTNTLRLIRDYQFQMFDAIVVSTALISGCSVLYSEDMHHNLNVDGQLKIINPFI